MLSLQRALMRSKLCPRLWLMANPSATQEEADAILDSLGIIPRVDANEADKMFENMSVTSSAYRYETYFTSGQIDELTLTVTPLAHEMQTTAPVDNSAAASEAKEQDTAAHTQQDVSDFECLKSKATIVTYLSFN